MRLAGGPADLRQKIGPRAIKDDLDSQRGGDDDVRLSGLDLLQYPRMQINQFGQLFLGVAEALAFLAKIVSKLHKTLAVLI